MDFFTGLPRTQRRHDAIWVVVDRLTKSAHFLPIRKDYSVIRLAETFQQEIVRLYGTPLAIGTRLCVPNDATLREALLTEAHSSPFSVHPGSTKMYHDLKQHFWWIVMKRDVATFVSKCLICQQVKIEHQLASGLLQPLDIPVWKLTEGLGNQAQVQYCLSSPDRRSELEIERPEMIKVTNKKVAVAKEKLKEARTRQKSY
nr:putative reverse transcriptase domain-containing protein [Tanacetum cinerariifolium]